MRVAFCLSGQLRTWKKCYTSWNLLFHKFKEQMYINDSLQYPTFTDEPFEVDYFIHTWDFNTPPHFKWDVNFEEPDPIKRGELLEPFKNTYTKIEKSEIEEVLGILKPKKALVEDWNVSKNCEKIMDDIATEQTYSKIPIKGHISWAGSQLHGIMKCAHLKRQYEIENKFEYDVCIRSRFDLEFDDNNRMIFARDFEKPKPKTLYSVHSFNTEYFPHDAVGDIFFYSDSETYDLMASLYNWLPQLDPFIFRDDFRIEEMLVYFARMFHIGTSKVKIDPEVRR